MAISLLERYIALFSLILALKIWTAGAATHLTDCAAVLDGPSTDHMSVLSGNEIMPVMITCNVTCLNRTDTGHYTPALSFVVTELETYEEFQGDPGTNEDLYRDIQYIRPASQRLCSDTNNWTMQYSYRIYPTINMNRTVVRCGVYYFYYRQLCWGNPVVLIRYNTSSPGVCPCTTDCSPTVTITTTCSDTTTENNGTTTTGPITVKTGGQVGLIAGVSSVTVIMVIVVPIVVLLLVVFGYKFICKKKRVRRRTTPDIQSTDSSAQ